jgi:hypothetical protein
LIAFAPQLQLETLFVLNEKGRIMSTREPDPSPGPRFALIRGTTSCAWATRADVSEELAVRVDELAREERVARDLLREPLHAHGYQVLLGGRSDSGPAFTFPDRIPTTSGIVAIDGLAPLQRYLRGWTEKEIPERSPILAVCEAGHAISVCFCARQSPVAAEAGVETAVPFRRRGFGARVTAAWALSILASGRLPLYSTSWSNEPSLAVARKLRLEMCANDWSLSD